MRRSRASPSRNRPRRARLEPSARSGGVRSGFTWTACSAASTSSGARIDLGPEFAGDLFVRGATGATVGGHLLRFQFNRQTTAFRFQDPRLDARVVDSLAKSDITESESLLVGREFGVVTDIETARNGNLYCRLDVERRGLPGVQRRMTAAPGPDAAPRPASSAGPARLAEREVRARLRGQADTVRAVPHGEQARASDGFTR